MLPPAGAAGVFCFGCCCFGCCLAACCFADFCADLPFCAVATFFVEVAFFAGPPPAGVFCFAFSVGAEAPAAFGFFCLAFWFGFCSAAASDLGTTFCADFCFCGVCFRGVRFAAAFFAEPRCPVDFARAAAFGAGIAASITGAVSLLLRPRFLLAEAGASVAPPPLAFFFAAGAAFAFAFFGCFSAASTFVGVAFDAFGFGFATALGAFAALWR